MSYTTYKNFYDLGKATNRNITNVYNTSNPLTYCLTDDPGSKFIHGSSAVNYTPYSTECQIYMSTRCAGQYDSSETWDKYCETYFNSNTRTDKPNNTPNALLSQSMNCMFGPFTTGQQVLRNALYRRFLNAPLCQKKMVYNQFDPNVANSPIIEAPNQNYCSQIPQVILGDISKLNSNPLLNKALDNYEACSDVLAVIFNHVVKMKINLKNTRLGEHFNKNQTFYKKIWNDIYSHYKFGFYSVV